MHPSRAGMFILAGALVFGCGEDPTPPDSLFSLQFAAVLVHESVGGARIRATVTISNESEAGGFVTLRNPCPVVLELHASDQPASPVIWDERRYLRGCKSFEHPVSIARRQSVSVSSLATPVAAILGDSLPDGRFWAVAVVVVKELPAGVLRLPLGPLDLAR